MDEQTTTDATLVEDTGAEQALPVEQVEQSAATENTAEPTTTEATGAEEALPEVEDKLKSFAKGQGIEDISQLSERELKFLKIAYDNQAEYQRTRQKTTELEKNLRSDISTATANGDTDLVYKLAAEVESLRLTQNINDFFSNGTKEEVAEKKALEPVMAKMVTDDPNLAQLVRSGYISYDQLFAMARGSDSSRDEKLRLDGGRDALKKVADKTTAKAVSGSATTADLSSAKEDDPFLRGFDKKS